MNLFLEQILIEQILISKQKYQQTEQLKGLRWDDEFSVVHLLITRITSLKLLGVQTAEIEIMHVWLVKQTNKPTSAHTN